MRGSEVDADRMVAGLRRRVLDADEKVTKVWPGAGPEAMVDTNRRSLTVYRPDWRLLSEPWVSDAVLVVWDGSAMSHTEERIFGLVFDREGREHLLSWDDDDLPDLGRRLAVEGEFGGLEPEAFAEVLALFHSASNRSGHLIADPAAVAEEFPALAELPGIHPVRSHRDSAATTVTLEFHAFQVYPGHGDAALVIRQWTVLASATQPATWTSHEIARLPVL